MVHSRFSDVVRQMDESMIRTKILYLSYNGMNEALGASQVLSYLFPLSADYDFYLVSLEKPEDWNDLPKMEALKKRLASSGIEWLPLEYKEDAVGKVLNWFRFTNHAYRTLIRHKIKFVHCRSYFPAMSAYFIQKIRPIRYLFDTRGFAFDERADIGSINRRSIVYKFFKFFERKLYKKAAGIIKLSNEGRRTILNNELFPGGDQLTNITVIPTCVDLERFQWQKRVYGDKVRIGYVGTAIGWYDFDRTLQALQAIGKQITYHFTIFNGGQHDFIREKLKQYRIPEKSVTLEKVNFRDMPARLSEFEIALFYIHPFFSKRASAATKLGELLASGIPVLTNGNVGDHEFYIRNHHCGKILDFNHLETYNFEEIFSELRTEETSRNCREVAAKYFSLEKGVKGYKDFYKKNFV